MLTSLKGLPKGINKLNFSSNLIYSLEELDGLNTLNDVIFISTPIGEIFSIFTNTPEYKIGYDMIDIFNAYNIVDATSGDKPKLYRGNLNLFLKNEFDKSNVSLENIKNIEKNYEVIWNI
jgi:hypothetical protein